MQAIMLNVERVFTVKMYTVIIHLHTTGLSLGRQDGKLVLCLKGATFIQELPLV